MKPRRAIRATITTTTTTAAAMMMTMTMTAIMVLPLLPMLLQWRMRHARGAPRRLPTPAGASPGGTAGLAP
jgi:hypothetical protein